MLNNSEWHNTGGNGAATQVWIRTVGNWTAEIKVMPYRCLVTMYFGNEVDADHDGIPFAAPSRIGDDYTRAKRWADSFLARHMAHNTGETEFHVCEGEPSWHQRRAGHTCAARTIVATRDEAEKLAAGLKQHHPGMTVRIEEHKRK